MVNYWYFPFLIICPFFYSSLCFLTSALTVGFTSMLPALAFALPHFMSDTNLSHGRFLFFFRDASSLANEFLSDSSVAWTLFSAISVSFWTP